MRKILLSSSSNGGPVLLQRFTKTAAWRQWRVQRRANAGGCSTRQHTTFDLSNPLVPRGGCLARRRPTNATRRAFSNSEKENEEIQKQLTAVVEDATALEAFSKELTKTQQERLSKLVSKTTGDAAAASAVKEPSWKDLRLVALNTALPFVGFGFMDNAILIVAGDAIDHSLGVWLGISTMCAAAIGNIVSDVAGVLLGTVVEDFCARYLSLPVPHLTTAQRQLRSVRFANQFGCAVGLIVGCIIGMFPLAFLDSNRLQARKRQAALDSLFQDVVQEAGGLVGAQRTRLYIVCKRPQDEASSSSSDHDFTSWFSSSTSKRRNRGLILPSADGDYLYAKYSQHHYVAGSESSTTETTDAKTSADPAAATPQEEQERWVPLGRGIVSRAALTGEVWNVDDVADEPDYVRDISASPGFEPRNILYVPVLDSHGRTVAVLQALNKRSSSSSSDATATTAAPSSFSDTDVQILQALASHVSITLQRMYFEADQEGAEEEEHSLKKTIQILKESGLVANDKVTSSGGKDQMKRPLFPEP